MFEGKPNFSASGPKSRYQVSLLVLILCWGQWLSLATTAFGQQDDSLFVQVGTLDSQLIPESSGLAMSFQHADFFWTINDSGNSNTVFGLKRTGELMVEITLEGATNRDWESMSRFSAGEVNYLVVAESGDNRSRYDSGRLYVFPEPDLSDLSQPVKQSVQPNTVEFVYEGGACDCEAVAVDPTTHDLWLFEKISKVVSQRKPGAFRIEAKDWIDQATGAETKAGRGGPIIASKVCDLQHHFITAGEFSRDGKRLIIRNYVHAQLFERIATANGETASWETVIRSGQSTLIPLPFQRQGESIAFTQDGQSVIVTSEFVKQPIWQVKVDEYLELLQKSKEKIENHAAEN